MMSPADLIDQLSILRIKERALGVDYTAEISNLAEHLQPYPNFERYATDLERLNQLGWDTNEIMFRQLAEQYPPETYGEALHQIAYARISHAINQARISLKNAINQHYGNSAKEHKSWQTKA